MATATASVTSVSGDTRTIEVTITDNNGKVHKSRRSVVSDQTDDALLAYVSATALDSAAKAEPIEYIQEISEGRNPFPAGGVPGFSSRGEMLGMILTRALSEKAWVGSSPNLLVLNGLQYLPLVTDAEMLSLFPARDQTWLDRVRASSAALLTAMQTILAYEPLI